MGNNIIELKNLAERMKKEQSDFKDTVRKKMQISVTDTDVKEKVDRLIYNHSLKKKDLQELFGLSRVTFNLRITQATNDGVIGLPIVQGRTHLYNRFDVNSLMTYLDYPR